MGAGEGARSARRPGYPPVPAASCPAGRFPQPAVVADTGARPLPYAEKSDDLKVRRPGRRPNAIPFFGGRDAGPAISSPTGAAGPGWRSFLGPTRHERFPAADSLPALAARSGNGPPRHPVGDYKPSSGVKGPDAVGSDGSNGSDCWCPDGRRGPPTPTRQQSGFWRFPGGAEWYLSD